MGILRIGLCLEIDKMSRDVRKPDFCICENKDADQLRGNREADHVFVFAIRIVQSLYYLNPKFQFSSHLLWLYSPVCVRPGPKPRRPVFSQRGSNYHQVYILSVLLISQIEPRCKKTGLRGFYLVGHKPGCTTTQDS